MKIHKAQLYEDLKQRILTMDLAPDADLDETASVSSTGYHAHP